MSAIKQLSVSIKQIIDCVDSKDLKGNGPFIKSVWTSAKELSTVASENHSYENTLINDVITLWNLIIDITPHDDDEVDLFLKAILKDTCFQVLKKLSRQVNHYWTALEMLVSLYSSWLAANDLHELSNVIDEIKKLDEILHLNDSFVGKYDILIAKAYICQSEYCASNLESWDRQLHWIDLGTKLPSFNESNDNDKKNNALKKLYSFVLHLVIQRRKKTESTLYWLVNSISHMAKQAGGASNNDCAEGFTYFEETLLSLLVNICEGNSETIAISEAQSSQLLDRFNEIPFRKESRNTPRFFLIKLYLMTPKSDAIAGPDFIKNLEDAYFFFIERLKFERTNFKENVSMLAVIIFKLDKNGCGLRSILRGLDLLIQRSKDFQSEIISIQDGDLYLFKVYVLSELITPKAPKISCTGTMDDPFVQECNYILKSAMNEEVYLVKEEEIDKANLETIIALLWRAGDVLLERKLHSIALLLYKYTLSLILIESSNCENMITLSYKIASCYEKMGDMDSAYVYFKKGFDSCNSSEFKIDVSASDCMTLIKYSLLQTTFSQLILVPPVVEKLGQCRDFDPNNMIFELIQLCFLHGKKTAILIQVLQTTIDCFKKATNAQSGIPYFQMTFVHQLILILRCLVYIKVHTYQVIGYDQKLRTRNLDFRSIALYIQRVCQILDDQNIHIIKADPTSALVADLKWLKYTCYNWVLFCFSVGRNQEASGLFVAIERITLHIHDQIFDDNTNCSQNRLIQMLKSCVEMMIRYHEENTSDEVVPIDHFAMMNKSLDILIGSNESDALSIPYLNSLFKIRNMLNEKKYDKATEIFAEHEKSPEYPLSVLEYMAAFVLQDPQCPIENAFIIVKTLQLRLAKSDHIKDYSKWTRILVTIALNRDSARQDLYDCIATIINQQVYEKDDYPQNELYYLVVSTWNEGITCYMKQMTTYGQQYCELAFKLLSSYKNADKKKELEIQMCNAYGLFKTK